VPASEINPINSQWFHEASTPGVRVIAKYGEAYEIIIDPSFFRGLKARKLNIDFDYSPIQPGETHKKIYGTHIATKKACDQWLKHVSLVVCSDCPLEVKQAYHHYAQQHAMQQELERAILIREASASNALTQENLARNLLLLYISLEQDHISPDACEWLMSDQDQVLERFQDSLPILSPPKRTKRDNAQLTSLVRALLKASGCSIDLQQHGFAEEYTADENADLFASLFGVTSARKFGRCDPEEMCDILSISPLFFAITIGVQDVEIWFSRMTGLLRLGFREGYLNLPSQVSSTLGLGQIENFNVYLVHMHRIIPSLSEPANNTLFLLSWSTMVSDAQLNVIREWATSENGQNLYKRLARDVQSRQSTEQLVLIIAALMQYRRLHPDLMDDCDQPISGSYVADLDAFLGGQSLGNSGKIAEQMIFALVRVLGSFADQHKSLITFLETALDRHPPLLHVFDAFSDQYWYGRISGQTHEAAMKRLLSVQMPGLESNDDEGWTTIAIPGAIPPPNVHVRDLLQKPLSGYTSPATGIKTSSDLSQESGHADFNTTHAIGTPTTVNGGQRSVSVFIWGSLTG